MKFIPQSLFVIIIVFISLLSYKNDNSGYFTISGVLDSTCTKFNNQYFYLYDLDNDTLIDSTLLTNNKFEFKIEVGDVRLVQISYRDTSNGIVYYRPLGIKSPYSNNTIECMFYIENVDFIIDSLVLKKRSIGNYGLLGKLSHISPQNVTLYNHANLYLIANRNDYFRNVELIQKYNTSVHLIKLLYLNKEYFDLPILKGLLLHFDIQVQSNNYYELLRSYISAANLYDKSSMNTIVFKDINLRDCKINYADKPYTLVVFWASWCVPCRKEIPSLKLLYNSSKEKLNIISVSVDTDLKQWEKAILEEKMYWTQYLLKGPSKDSVVKRFDISAIPKMYLYKSDTLIFKNVGYTNELKKEIEEMM